MAKKVEAINKIEIPKIPKQFKSFLGMVNFYRDMWKRRSHMIAPLTELTSIKSKSKFVEIWSERHTHAFNVIKEALAWDVLLEYPDFSKPFHIHTDASEYQLGSVISQDNKPLAFYSRKLSTA